jgi:geranylgeranyl reductase family protein
MKYDVAIIGAGPAGCSAALGLKDSGLSVVLIDKEIFPRDKICGDAIPGKALKSLEKLNPAYSDELWNIEEKAAISGSKVFSGTDPVIEIAWKERSFNCRRELFDNTLLGLVKNYTDTKIITGKKVNDILRTENEITLAIGGSPAANIKCKFVIGADGAYSVVSRLMAGNRPDSAHLCGAVRAYYRGVKGVENNITEVHLFDDYIPGYFWIFPLGNDLTNVGFGMLSSAVKNKGISLKSAFKEIIENDDYLGKRFCYAKIDVRVKGYSLPIGFREDMNIAGNNYYLAGDAASLIDPLDGHGIENGVLSGLIAAENAEKFFKSPSDTGIKHYSEYSEQIYRKIGKELRRKEKIMRLLGNNPKLLKNILTIAGNKTAKRFLRRFL